MIDILHSSLTGNIIGGISLLVGIVGLFITLKTMKSAKRIEEELQHAKIVALDKMRFNNNKKVYCNKIQRIRSAVLEQRKISYSICNNTLSIINDLLGYENVITGKDREIITEQKNRLKIICEKVRNRNIGNNIVQEFDEIVSNIISIINKGDYEL